MTTATVLSIAYGYQVKEQKDTFVDIMQQVMEEFSEMCVPGAFLVDVIPWCKCIYVFMR